MADYDLKSVVRLAIDEDDANATIAEMEDAGYELVDTSVTMAEEGVKVITLQFRDANLYNMERTGIENAVENLEDRIADVLSEK